MPQVRLVADEHDDNVRVCMIPELLEPSADIDVARVLGDVVDEQGTHRSTVVGRSDGSVSLLTSRVPDLCLDSLAVDCNAPGSKLDTNGTLALQRELVAVIQGGGQRETMAKDSDWSWS